MRIGLFYLTCLLGASSALAGDDPTVAVVGLHSEDLSPDDQSAAVLKLSKAFSRGGLAPLDPTALALQLQGKEAVVLREAFVATGRELLDQGKALYQQAQFAEAVPVLEQAIENLTPAVPAANDTRELWEAWVVLGSVHLLSDDESSARDAYAAAIALNPARSPNAATWPPNVVSVYKDAQQQLVTDPATLRVRADGKDVDVFVDGVNRGVAPVKLDDLVPGTHHIVARGDTGSHAYEQVEVIGGDDLSIQLRMSEPSLGTAARSRLGRVRQTSNLYRALGTYLDVDLVLLAGSGDETVYLQLYAPRADAFSSPVEVPFSGSPTDEATDAVADLLKKVKSDGSFYDSQTSALAVPLDVGTNVHLARLLLDPVPPDQITVKKGPSWVLVGAIGVGAAVVATGTALWLTADRAHYKGTIVVELP